MKLLKFYTPTCQPCKQVTQELATVLPDFPHVSLVEVNVAEQPELALQYGIRSVPALVLLDGSEAPVGMLQGNKRAHDIRVLLAQ